MFKYFDYWKGAYPLLLEYIKEVNPDAKVVLVGTMNPIMNATIADNVPIRIGKIINVIFDLMNAYTRMWATKYGYMYVDITDVETPSVATQTSIGYILSIPDETEFALHAHPTTKGYSQIAEKIIAAVDNSIREESIKTDFSIGAVFDVLYYYLKATFVRFIAKF